MALGLAIFTIVYNLVESVISAWFGIEEESLVLFGFGSDSLIEVISGVGIAYMVIRLKKSEHSEPAEFEKAALKTTGFAFYLLVVFLLVSAIYSIIIEHQPQSGLPGIIVSGISIIVMIVTIYLKEKVAAQLNSDAIRADAACARVCIYMSVLVLIAGLLEELWQIKYVDAIGTLGLAYFSFKEGRECFEKVKTGNLSCQCH